MPVFPSEIPMGIGTASHANGNDISEEGRSGNVILSIKFPDQQSSSTSTILLVYLGSFSTSVLLSGYLDGSYPSKMTTGVTMR